MNIGEHGIVVSVGSVGMGCSSLVKGVEERAVVMGSGPVRVVNRRVARSFLLHESRGLPDGFART